MPRGRAEFVPFAMEIYGAFGVKCSTIINALAREAEQNVGITQSAFKTYAYRKLSMDLQFGNAALAFDGIRKVRSETSPHNISRSASKLRTGA